MPEATSAAKVYLIPKNRPGLLAKKQAQQFAEKLEFPKEPVERESDSYIFKDLDYSARTLNFNPATKNFFLNYDLNIDSSPAEGASLTFDENRAVEEAETLLQSLDKFDESIKEGKPLVSYYKWQNNDFFKINNRIGAQFIRIDFFSGSN